MAKDSGSFSLFKFTTKRILRNETQYGMVNGGYNFFTSIEKFRKKTLCNGKEEGRRAHYNG